MTIHDPATIADALHEQLVLAVGSDTDNLDPAVLADAIIGVCDELGVVVGDVYAVVSDAISMLLPNDDQHTVAIHVTPAEARDMLQAMDTFRDCNYDDPDVQALWQRTEDAAVRLGVAFAPED